MSAPKKKRLSLSQKVEILKKIDSGFRANRLAMDFGLTESAISQLRSDIVNKQMFKRPKQTSLNDFFVRLA